MKEHNTKHERRAARYGRKQGRYTGQMMNPAELEHQAESSHDRIFKEDVESEDWQSVGYHFASHSRDIGGSDGLHRYNQLESIAASGVALSRFTENGDSCMHSVYQGASSGVVSDMHHLLDDVIEAYDRAYAAAFAEEVDQ